MFSLLARLYLLKYLPQIVSPAPKPNQTSAPETPTSGRETPKDPKSAEKLEKERAKRERKKERGGKRSAGHCNEWVT